MNYLVAADRFFPDAPGGQYAVAWELAKAARAEGIRTTLLCGSLRGDPPAGRSDVDGIEVVRYRIPDRAAWKLSRFGDHARAAATAFRKHLSSTRWDTVHAHALVSGSLLGEVLVGRRMLYTAHSPAVLEQALNWSAPGLVAGLRRAIGSPAVRRVERTALRSATTVHVLSDYTSRELEATHGNWLRERIVRIPWWSERPSEPTTLVEARTRLTWPQELPVILSLRRLVPRMGLDTLIDAVRLAGESHAFLTIIAGKGPERELLERRGADLVASGRLRFLGGLSDQERSLAYHAADLFVVPSRALECFGIIVLEALGRGCPVVASRAGALPEIMDAVLPGWTFEPGDAQGLADVLDRFLRRYLRAPSRADLEEWTEARYGRERIWPAYRTLIGASE